MILTQIHSTASHEIYSQEHHNNLTDCTKFCCVWAFSVEDKLCNNISQCNGISQQKREGLLSMNSCLAKITVVTSMFTKLELLKKY